MKLKYIFAYIIVGTIFFIAGMRIYTLNVVDKEKYRQILDSQKNKIISLSSAPRGRIIDRNGNILVDNIGSKSIVYHKIDGITTKEELKIANKLVSILNLEYKESLRELKDYYLIINEEEDKKLITEEEYEKVQNRKLTSDDLYKLKLERITDDMLNSLDENQRKAAHIYALMNKGYKYEVKTIKNEASEEEYAKVLEEKIPGVTGSITWQRTYPYKDVLKKLFGTVSSSDKGIPLEKKEEYLNKGYSLDERVGTSYLESQYEEYLKGTKATYRVNDDNTLTLLTKEKRGNDLVLSIDINLQMQVEEIIRNKILEGKKQRNTEYYNHAYVIISDPNDGSILAFAGQQLEENTNEFKDISLNIISANYTMGSVVKGASQTVGYQAGVIDVTKKLIDSCVKLYLVPQKCSFKKLGALDDIGALKWSSNYYQFITAIKTTNKTYTYNMKLQATMDDFKRYRDTFASFGLGVKTGIDLPNEKEGVLGNKVADDLLLNLAIGQYDTYTPIELVQYINTIASSGKRLKLSLMKEILHNDEILKKHEATILNEVSLDPYYFARIKEGFRQVLNGGTGAGYTPLEYNPAGKTGTSESFYDSDNDGISDVKTISMSYAMFAPVDNPKYSMVVLSPHVSHTNSKVEHIAYINKHIAKEVSKILFENY